MAQYDRGNFIRRNKDAEKKENNDGVACFSNRTAAGDQQLCHFGPSQTINYQGVLATSGKTPVTATVSMVFALYTADTGGTALWTETQSVGVTKGAYSVVLGSTNPIGLPFNTPYYLGVTVGTDAEMTPRLALTSSPYAFNVVNGAITDLGISGTAAIADSKLAQIASAGKVSGAALTSLSSIPAGAGSVAVANGGTGATTLTGYLKGNGSSALTGSATIPAGDLSGTLAAAQLQALVGDSGAGGTKGAVPAPAAGDAAAGKFLKADGTWSAPSGGGSSSGNVTDSAGHLLGRFISVSGTGVTIFTPTSFLVLIKWDGTVSAGQMYYTGASCTGTAYQNSASGYSKQVYYSNSFASLMVPYAADSYGASAVSAAGTITAPTIDNPTCGPSNVVGTLGQATIRLKTATVSDIGFASGATYPVATPLHF